MSEMAHDNQGIPVVVALGLTTGLADAQVSSQHPTIRELCFSDPLYLGIDALLDDPSHVSIEPVLEQRAKELAD